MDSSGIRLLLTAGAAAVLASWAFDTFSSGMSTDSTVVAIGLCAALSIVFGLTHLIDHRSARSQASGADGANRPGSGGDSDSAEG